MKCKITGVDMLECAHCTQDDYILLPAPGPQYETTGFAFKSLYKGVCTIEPRHTIRKGDLVSRVQRADNPSIVITGVACRNCTLMLPKGKG